MAYQRRGLLKKSNDRVIMIDFWVFFFIDFRINKRLASQIQIQLFS